MKNKKKIRLFLVLFLLIGIGVTIAYFYNSTSFANIFVAKKIPTVTTKENFTSPEGWEPGDTTPKTITTTNVDSDNPICIRLKFDESWINGNGEDLSLFQNNNRAAIINLINDDVWIKAADGWYYYQVELAKGESSVSPLESVTFNPEIIPDLTCTTTTENDETTKICTSSGNGYDGGVYTLDITTEASDCTDDLWDPNYPSKLYIAIATSKTNYRYNGANVGSIDTLDTLTTPKTIFFEKSNEANNVIFANSCWRIIRTTETGGVKLLYNGLPDDNGGCGTDREKATGAEYDQVGITADKYSYGTFNGNYLYSYKYIYNKETGKFKLGDDAELHNYATEGIDALRGMYTCAKSTNTDCDSLYLMFNTNTSTSAFFGKLDDNLFYNKVGNLPYNFNTTSFGGTTNIPGYIGYMYDPSTLTNDINSANMKESLQGDNVNKQDSLLKIVIDSWYLNNISGEDSEKLEDIVFCNDRNYEISSSKVEFTAAKDPHTLGTCTNITDKFSMSNEKAKLKYPVGVITYNEARLMGRYSGDSKPNALGTIYWTITAVSGGGNQITNVQTILANGDNSYLTIDEAVAAIPVVSLKPEITYIDGDGSTSKPYVIE